MTPLTHSELLYLWLTLSVLVDMFLGFAPSTKLRSLVQPIVVAGLLTYLVYLVQP